MSSLTITVNSDRTEGNLQDLFLNKEGRVCALRLKTLFRGAASGQESCEFYIASSADAPVRATGSITAVYANLIATDSVSIGGTVLTCVSAGTPTSAQFKKETSLAVTLSNLAATINAHTTLSKYLIAVASATAVSLTCRHYGVIGNAIVLSASVGTPGALAVSAFSGGAGGAESALSTYEFAK